MANLTAQGTDDDVVRDWLDALLQGGLETEHRERAYTDKVVSEIVGRLRLVAEDDYEAKLAVAGFTREPFVGEGEHILQACETCMYYVVHRRFCERPELMLPVKPYWSCRLWRI
jgi:hypothetical protein